jgi:hypothetical protein
MWQAYKTHAPSRHACTGASRTAAQRRFARAICGYAAAFFAAGRRFGGTLGRSLAA